ncbi:CehA/McbA family metallohydrolase [Spirosoma taeanense]|uniref:CehA/McbA family metallohydrolase n=1 Tax=Spirosoma taeanense TaxID=2735870 RepID=A0A6M5YAC1_9BACT|nr:CehA/McbA family metallohydrolase [Spirosoma taeanense]QJW91148.1 CehA/McbA family metallohydrolase [Spirosoma taeanense]
MHTPVTSPIYSLVRTLFLALMPIMVHSQSTRQARTSQLTVTLLDASTDKPTPTRVRLTQNGRVVAKLPAEAVAVMYGLWDHEDGYAYQPDSSFYVAGRFQLNLPPGRYQLTLSKGNEYLRQEHELVVKQGVPLRKTFRLQRWVNMAAKGWYSTDGHIHLRRSPRENPLILTWLQAEDVNVGALLRMGDFWETYYPQYAYGQKGLHQQGNFLLTSGQEDPRTPELGHAFALGAADRVRRRDRYYLFDEVFDKIHQLGGLVGYAHQAETFHGYRGLTLDGLRGKVDALELLQFCVDEHPLHTEHYYHFLDLGIPLTATAGSDFPWCGRDHGHGPPERSARIGNARFYTYLNDSLTFANWRNAVQAGHTFVSSGPILDLRVNNALPGDRLNLKRGSGLTATVHAYGHANQVPLDTLELISHGRVIGRVTAREAGQSAAHLTLTVTLSAVERGQWMAARCTAGPGQAAHTTPVYVTIDGGGFHNPETASRYLDLSEQYLREIEQEISKPNPAIEVQAWRYQDGLKTRIAETRRIIADLRKKLR